jgi:hypothetical protein
MTIGLRRVRLEFFSLSTTRMVNFRLFADHRAVCVKQMLDRVISLLIVMTDLAKPNGQKRVNDRSEENDGCNKVERFPLNPPREFSEKRRNLLVMVAIHRQRKIYSRPQ